MSYRCGNCGKQQPDGSQPKPTIVETRVKTYPRREYTLRGKELVDRGGVGRETVREVLHCNNCFIDAGPGIRELME